MERQIYVSKQSFNNKLYERFIQAADIGGEHTYVAILGIKDKKNYDIIFKHVYLTKEIRKVFEVLNQALADAYYEYGIEINRAVIAAAGPISRKRSYIKLTNIDLIVDSQEILRNSLLRKIILINDFEAIGYGLDLLDMKKDVLLLPHVGDDLTNSSILSNTFAVIGAGKGLGTSIAYYDTTRHMHVPLPSEGGHIEFSPHDSFELEMVDYLKSMVQTKHNSQPEFERLVSGNGIINIYNFLRYKKIYPETNATKRIDMLEGTEKLRAIDQNLNDETCKKTLELFIKFYARAAKNLAFMAECYSGLFIASGIVLRYIDKFKDGSFMHEFEIHDIRNDVLRKTPVYIVTNRDIPLLGCGNVAINFYNLY